MCAVRSICLQNEIVREQHYIELIARYVTNDVQNWLKYVVQYQSNTAVTNYLELKVLVDFTNTN
jgi:hypothetical protein